jgi:homoserine acetyltransferase
MEALERRVTGRCRHGTVDACIPAEETMNDLPLRPAADIGVVEDRFFTLRNFLLTDGTIMPEATIAYETYGRPASDGRNAILCTRMVTRPATISPAATRRTATSPARGTA